MCFTLRDSQLMRFRVLHFERFSAHETSGASLREILGSWQLGSFTLKGSQNMEPRGLYFHNSHEAFGASH